VRATFHGFKKVASDQKSTTFRHPNGSELKVAHASLDPKTLKQLSKMPMHLADGGEADETLLEREQRAMAKEDAAEAAKPETPSVPFGQRALQVLKSGNHQLGAETAADQQERAPYAQDDLGPAGPAPTNVDLSQASSPPDAPMGAGAQASPVFGADMGSGIQTQMGGVQNEARATAQMEAEKAAAYNEHMQAMKRLNDEAQVATQQNQSETQNMIDDMRSGHIDPKHYVNNLTGGQKISTAIGLLLGGMGQGLIGGSNPALDLLNKSVDDDIRAQMDNQNNKNTVFNAMQKQYGNKMDAMNMTRAFYVAKLQNDIQTAAAKFGSPIAMARAQQIIGPLQQQLNMLHQQTGIRQAAMRGGNGQMDPASLVPFLVPKEHQQKVFDEIDTAQNTARSAKAIMSAWDKAANNLHGMDFVPGTLNADQKAFHAMMGPTFKDVEGTVRQAAMDNMFSNVTPQFGDSDNTKKTKRAALEEYLTSKIAAPTAKGYGLDLTRFKSTNYGGAHFKRR
jgi:hypothetical protein